MLLPGTNPQVEGSAVPVAMPGCHDDTSPDDTSTVGPHGTSPDDESLRNTWYCIVELALSVLPIIDVEPDSKLLKLAGS